MASFISAVPRGLQGKVSLITRGASSISECTARVLAHHGVEVVIADIQDELSHSVGESIGLSSCTYVHCDVTDESQMKNAIDKTVATCGKLDITFNNVGVIDENKPLIINNEKFDFERVLSVNFTGIFLGIKHAARVMVPARSGCMISTASVSSALGGAGSHAYPASKYAVLGLTRNAATELGQFGIRVNCLSPFACAAPLAKKFVGIKEEELGKMASLHADLKGVALKTEDVANAALLLASEEARYVSGHKLFIEGGYHYL